MKNSAFAKRSKVLEMRRYLVLGLMVLGCVCAHGQINLVDAAKSPYDLAEFISSHNNFDWKPLWQSLGLNEIAIEPCDDAPHRCEVELIAVPAPQQIIAVLGGAWQQQVYLRYFSISPAGWRLAGVFHPYAKYFTPHHRMTRIGRKPFFLVTGQGQSGSGLSTEREYWFDLTLQSFEPVFEYISKGHVYLDDFNIGRDMFSSVKVETEPTETIIINRGARIDFQGKSLGMMSAKSVYVRPPGQKKFIFDLQKSSAPEDQIISVYENEGDGLSNEDYLKYNFTFLKHIASDGMSEPKHTLADLLEHCGDTSEKRALQNLLHSRK